jgi:hypothetical protein
MVAHGTIRVWRVAKVGLVAAGICYLGLLVVVQVSEWTVRRRAEQLLADFRDLRVGTSTFSEAQAFMGRWKRWEAHSQCGATGCEYQVEIRDWMWKPILAFPSTAEYLSRVAAIVVRDHQPIVTVDLKVSNGVLDWASVSATTVVPKGYGPGWEGPEPEPDGYVEYKMGGYWLMTSAKSVLRPYVSDPGFSVHPAYIMRPPEGCEGCMGFFTEYTPAAKPEDVFWLTEFDFSCMTRWSTCTHAGELLPEAWKRYQAEAASRRQ